METTHTLAHLGQYPYHLVDVLQACQPSETMPKPGTDCDHCGTYITNIFVCKSSDGKTFKLGSSCVDKLGDKGLISQVREAQRKIAREKREAKRREEWEAGREEREAEAARVAAEQAERKAALAARYEAAKPKLAKLPHPNAYFASKGKTLLDYTEFMGGIENWKVERILTEVK